MKKNFLLQMLTIAAFGSMFMLASCGTPSKKSGKELFSQYFVPVNDDTRAATVRGEGDDEGGAEDQVLAQQRAAGYAAFVNKDYAQATKILEDYYSKKASDLQVPYYLGISYLALDNPTKSEPFFKNLMSKPNSLYFENAQWYMALIYLYKGQLDQSKALLDQIIANKKHYFNDQAQNLIDEVEYLISTGGH